MLYIFPTDLEAQHFREISPDSRVVISGVGMVATATTIMRLVGSGDITLATTVILAGVAGSYGESIAVGDVVEVTEECCAELPSRFQVRYCVEPSTTLRNVVSNTVHSGSAMQGGAQVENMEGATFFALAKECGFRAVQIRAISNRVGESFENWHLDEALGALAKVLQTLTL